jgi:shikimate dehydrogenase
METSAKFGLIGKNLLFFSKKYFEQKFQKLLLNNHSYNIIDLENLDNIKNIF